MTLTENDKKNLERTVQLFFNRHVVDQRTVLCVWRRREGSFFADPDEFPPHVLKSNQPMAATSVGPHSTASAAVARLIADFEEYEPFRNPLTVEARNGITLQSGCVDFDDPDACEAGEYLLLLDDEKGCVKYLETTDLAALDYNGLRQALCEFVKEFAKYEPAAAPARA